MKRKYMKQLKHCFRTNQFNKNNKICRKCQFYTKCKKEQRTEYKPIELIPHPKYGKIPKKYRGRFTPMG